ncbi:nitroreductase family protein [Paenibacillus polymyxa]|uniref:nitroreductase family protein n=1 Tax=Paenibacillus polymyxa TaxID=1406 RepID=UPI00237963C5|nr:nitroreductase family protein [Paenibacillus polymyxa]WDM20587.1 nitroreductase family protein [Paenibacillus polymyxa]
MSLKNESNRVEELAKTFTAEHILENMLDKSLLKEILKFHQRTTWQDVGDQEFDQQLLEWLDLTQYTDVIPEYYEKKLEFKVERIHCTEGFSKRKFNQDFKMDYNQLGELLYNAFGRADGFSTKPYPSAGALYPVIPLMIILDKNAIHNITSPGCYVFDTKSVELLLIKSFTAQEVEVINENIYGSQLSKMFLGYAIDIRRAILKYKSRGYRHALMEVGLMAQSFRNSLNRHAGYGECSWSGFNDNALTNILGLSPRLSPIILLQWFGKLL